MISSPDPTRREWKPPRGTTQRIRAHDPPNRPGKHPVARPCILGFVLDWPAVVEPSGVAAVVERVHERRGRAWVVEGAPGVGSSTFARAVCDALHARGYEVLSAPAMRELAEVPLGAMMPLLASERGDDDTAAARLQRLLGRLAHRDAHTVLFVDGAGWLDELSAAAVSQIVRAYGARCILTARRGQALLAPLAQLEDDGLLGRIGVEPLDQAATATLAESALGEPIAPESLIGLVERCGGHPLFLRMLLEASMRDGYLHDASTGAVLGTPAPPARIVELVLAWAEEVPADARETLHLLAVAGSLPRTGLSAVAVDRLRAAALVTVTAATAVLAFPLVGEIIVEHLAPDERDATRLRAAEILADSSDDADHWARIAILAHSSRPPATGEVARAAHWATLLGHHAAGVELAERADEIARRRGEPPPLEALVLRGESLWLLGRRAEADAVFDAALSAQTDDAGISLAASRASAHWAIRHHDLERGIRIETEALSAISDPSARDFLLASTATWRILMGTEYPEAPVAGRLAGLEFTEPVIDPIFVGTLAGILAGDVPRARAAIAEGRPTVMAMQPLMRNAAELMDFGEAILDAMDGHLDDARRTIAARATVRVGEAAGTWSFGGALLEFHGGSMDAAARHAESAVDQLAWRDLLALRGTAIALRASVAAWLGDAATASALLRELDAASRRIVLADLQAAQAESWIAYRAGSETPAASIERAVSAAAGTGHDGWLAFAAHGAIRMGVPDRVLGVLHAADPRPHAASFHLIVAHGEALARRDAPGLVRAAEALESAGLHGAAHDAARQVIEISRPRASNDVTRRARVLLGRVTERLSPPPRSARSRGGEALSAREWSIASAAAARERNREIADRLGLSLRTVENHLASVYRKLGVRGRDELRAALDDRK